MNLWLCCFVGSFFIFWKKKYAKPLSLLSILSINFFWYTWNSISIKLTAFHLSSIANQLSDFPILVTNKARNSQTIYIIGLIRQFLLIVINDLFLIITYKKKKRKVYNSWRFTFFKLKATKYEIISIWFEKLPLQPNTGLIFLSYSSKAKKKNLQNL